MKNKGISLIVLIITIVVIIILATAIIVNIAQTNMIENAKEAVVKQDFKTMQDELTMYKSDKFVETRGDFKAEDLDVTDKAEIEKIIPSIVGTKYEAYVLIEDGNIAISQEMPEKERTWAMEALGLVKTSTNRPTQDTTAPTVPITLELTVDGNNITAVASGSTDDKGTVTYEYSLDNVTWQTSGEFKNLEEFKEYTVYARAIDKAGNKSDVLSNKVTTEELMLVVFDNTKGSANTTINGGKFTYDNPVVPIGFKAVTTAEAAWSDEDNNGKIDGWNNGLVIADKSGNEFVWVPVDGTNVTYAKWCTKGISYTSTSDDTAALPMKDETTRVTETEQITKYGGFYIGRYEAGIPEGGTASNTTGIPTIQQGATVWTNINYAISNTNAKSFVNTDNVKSGLVTGTQWDTVMKWIENAGINVTDSTSWGNYKNDPVDGNNGKHTAGSKEEWKAKNIYDLAGNTCEWTGEIYSSFRIRRGGYYYDSGSAYPASYRLSCSTSNTYDYLSFRLSLYVM